MSNPDGDSLKDEMNALLQADRERAKERRPTMLVETEPPAREPEPELEPEPEPPRGRFRRLFG